MLPLLHGPLSLTPETSRSDDHNPEVARLPHSHAGDSPCTGELTEGGRFIISESPEHRLVAINEPGGVGAERLRTLASRLKRAQQRYAIKKILVTSAVPGEGKTLISANLAITLAMHRQRTLIVDGDLRGGSLSGLLDIRKQPGLADWWESSASLMGTLYRAEQIPLWVLPAGQYLDSPLTLLQSKEMAELLVKLNTMFDWIVIDSPPLTPFSDGATLANLSDAVLLVARQGVTPKRLLREALKSIEGARIIATVLNEATVSNQQYYHRYYQQGPRRFEDNYHPRLGQFWSLDKK
jgi:capsular exopolysaccharide synthesis family protein